MPKGEVFVNAPPEQVFPAISDLTRHAKWAADDIEIQLEGSDTGQTGGRYTSGFAGKNKDQVTVTEVAPNQRFSFHVIMPNKIELDHNMTMTPPEWRYPGYSQLRFDEIAGTYGPFQTSYADFNSDARARPSEQVPQ